MSTAPISLFWPLCIFIITLFIMGFYCIFATYNLIRALIGVEILIKAVTLLIIVVGYVTGNEVLTQACVITLIVIEVVIMAVAAGIILGLHAHNQSLDVRKLRNLKG